jgi:hypothetical protein
LAGLQSFFHGPTLLANRAKTGPSGRSAFRQPAARLLVLLTKGAASSARRKPGTARELSQKRSQFITNAHAAMT